MNERTAAGPRLYRVRLYAPARAMPELLERLEPLADAVSVFEHEVDEAQEPVSFEVDLWLARAPDAAALRAALERAGGGLGLLVPDPLPIEEQPPETWLEAARMRSAPIRVGRFFVHSDPSEPVPPATVPILVEPGLAFGSGEHPTTRLCLRAIEHAASAVRYARALDLGCGSGILAIAAAKARPSRVWAADNDPIAVRVARENVRRNRVADRVRVLLSDGLAHPALRRAAPFDLVLANILADPLLEMAEDLARATAPGGRLVLSGFLDRQAGAVEAAYRAQGLVLLARLDERPWSARVFGRRKRFAAAGRRA
ncbi:MAG: 50S ribosomal protein L11 methyltransferase [Geminicoccaceae bacterium]|nr:50S ribosomal protein L11 methyltransferase [Geminicoccaceae bacterium]MCS7267985.1 50S ribosomal protein L11 methyltransferase [Geminicoccaceae bacterium]MCX7629866.1 50S ribosomal protein L11 methyltransferase [Geminicoccaceae bacterium]MDW8124101.1 50S ribosomal protein L11 methyltransferase [Geminicoccaceae bacterium]MDW8340236.1 50S ribosomal protein L11 methyltransferase [Geminicoccaceae bacterium]